MADKKENEEYYSYLVINTTKRAGFLMLFSFLYTMMTAAVMAHIIAGGSWTQLLIPILLIAGPIVIFPAVEKWEYKPWQAKAQKYERHYRS